MSVQDGSVPGIRVVLADDQELVRSGFAMILNAQPDIEVVAEAGGGAAALEAVREHTPDVVLLDIRMPGMDGIEAARVVCAETSCRVIMLTTFDQDDGWRCLWLSVHLSPPMLRHPPAPRSQPT